MQSTSATIAVAAYNGPIPQEDRPDPCAFIQQPLQAVDLLSPVANTHMISSLNWMSPTMDFDLTGFDYNPMPSGDQYWGSPTDVNNDLANQASSTIQSNMTLISDQSHSTPAASNVPDSTDVETPGTSYVDNKGARQPRNGRYANRIFGEAAASRGPPRTGTRSKFPIMTPEADGFSLGLTTILDSPNLLEQTKDSGIRIQPFSVGQYHMMCEAFQDCCLTLRNAAINVDDDGPFSPPEVLPPISAFNRLLKLYRQRFDHKVLPIIHHELEVDEELSYWVAKLAMSAIGSQYMEAEGKSMELTVALHEFLRRVLRHQAAGFATGLLTTETLGLVQARLLNYIGLAYCGSKRLEKYKMSALNDLVGEYKSFYRTQSTVVRGGIASGRRHWILCESARRLCHAIWLIESMSRYHFGTPSSLLLDFADIALPCTENIWQAEANDLIIQSPIIDQPTLEKALRVLYVEKRLLKGIGDFSQILIIHGLYCHTWDIAKSFSRPLLRWTPSAQKGDAESCELTSPYCLPQTPLYNQWRNAACDCLDVLHWIANSDIAKTGTENATVLHLHFARIVILTPYQTIRDMAELLVSEDVDVFQHGSAAAETFQEQCREVFKWTTDDQFKAHLALVHCGVLFWHVRRYSMDSFYEPTKVFLATLVLWAYGSICPPPPQQQQQATRTSTISRAGRSMDITTASPCDDEEGELSSDLDDISSIRLDRPADDELVQIFIKRGRFMNATITGVGNITAPQGPVRMLREGCRLLSTLDKWDIRYRYLRVLTRLMDICVQDRQWPFQQRASRSSQDYQNSR